MGKENIDRARAYIDAYNRFDIDGMMEQLHPDVTFQNYTNEQLTLERRGTRDFREQAEAAAKMFSERNQEITKIRVQYNSIVFEIAYVGKLSIDLPNGPRAGEKVELSGVSEFKFLDGKIIAIIDRS
ncbi:MAG: nuclear transport factor 2 family protein [Parvularcula sp.]|jgi:hypothetical protein|nr:nuclear transport factor 2 family protein [Parvularcula sp.]